jgi:sugar lactone lactonase YvrE
MMRATVCAALLVAAGCKPAEKTAKPVAPTRVASVEGFLTPESVMFDARQDVYFVSNINGSPGVKDNNGFISRVKPEGTVETLKFIEGGKNGVTLNAPKGLAVRGDTLWVTDIDVVRAFNAKTGAPIASVTVPDALFLNDPAFGLDGSLYVTDTRVVFDAKGGVTHPSPDRIFRIAPDRKVTTALQSDTLERPNGITWDKAGNRFLVVAFGGPHLYSWKPGDAAPAVFGTGAGQFDGVEVVGSAVWVSSWADSSVYRYENGTGAKAITGVPTPADIGYDAKRNRLLIPIFTGNRVEIWQLP